MINKNNKFVKYRMRSVFHLSAPVLYITDISVVYLAPSCFTVTRHTSAHTMLLIKRQFVVTHTIRQTEIPVSLNSWVANTPYVKMCVHNKIACPYISIEMYNTLTFWSDEAASVV
jgi:hypothetical protein